MILCSDSFETMVLTVPVIPFKVNKNSYKKGTFDYVLIPFFTSNATQTTLITSQIDKSQIENKLVLLFTS